MNSRPILFISAVSSELSDARRRVVDALQILGYDAEWQDVFGTEHGDVSDMLRRKIRQCKGVIHIVGERYGCEMPVPDPKLGEASYTQFEALYAESIGKPVWPIITGPDFKPPADLLPENEELSRKQLEYREKITAASPDLFHEFDNNDQLQLAILKIQNELSRLRRRARQMAVAIAIAIILLLGGVGWLIFQQSDMSSQLDDVATGQSEVSQKLDTVASEQSGVSQKIDTVKDSQSRVETKVEDVSKSQKSVASKIESVKTEVDRTANEVTEAKRAAVDAKNTTERIYSQAEIENARRVVNDATSAADRAPRGLTAAMELLLASDISYEGANLNGTNFKSAKLNGNNFTRCTFVDSNLRGANLNQCILDNANLSFAELNSADLANVRAEKSLFEYSLAINADFNSSKLRQSSFFYSDLRNADFSNADLRGACLACCDLTGADFSGADLTDAIMLYSILDEVKLSNAKVQDLDVGQAVSSGLTIDEKQKAVLVKSASLINLDISWWATDSEGNYNSSRPFHSDSAPSFQWRKDRLNDTLKPRSVDSLQPVGAFHNYTLHGHKARGGNQVYAHWWATNHFLGQANRRSRLIERYKEHEVKLYTALEKGQLVEGGYVSKWIEQIATVSSDVIISEAPELTKDTMLVLKLREGVIDPSENDWRRYAKDRCQFDASGGNDGWPSLYPLDCVHDWLPDSHVEYYKKWTLNRAKHFPKEGFKCVYKCKWSDWKKAKNASLSVSAIKPFATLPKTYEHLHCSMELPRRASKKLIGTPGTSMRAGPTMEFNQDRSSYLIYPPEVPQPSNKTPDKPFPTRTVELVVWFTFNGSRLAEKHMYFQVKPLRAEINVDGGLIWKGPIKTLEEGHQND